MPEKRTCAGRFKASQTGDAHYARIVMAEPSQSRRASSNSGHSIEPEPISKKAGPLASNSSGPNSDSLPITETGPCDRLDTSDSTNAEPRSHPPAILGYWSRAGPVTLRPMNSNTFRRSCLRTKSWRSSGDFALELSVDPNGPSAKSRCGVTRTPAQPPSSWPGRLSPRRVGRIPSHVLVATGISSGCFGHPNLYIWQIMGRNFNL